MLPENLSWIHIYSQISIVSVGLTPLLFFLFNRNPDDQTKLHKENKQGETETETGPCSTVASLTQKEVEGRNAVMLLAHTATESWPQLS